MGIPLLIILLFALAWVVLILPKQRELKRHNALVASLEVGDEVMTGSGIYGTLTEIAEDRVRIEVAPGLQLTLARRAVAAKIPAPSVDPAGPADSPDAPELDGPVPQSTATPQAVSPEEDSPDPADRQGPGPAADRAPTDEDVDR